MNRIIQPIAKIHTDFPDKFGIPRQSGLVKTKGRIIFEPAFRANDSLKGLEDYSHIWLIWGFSNPLDETTWTPTVRPPKLGGNIRKGVFATRSPFRPNGLGLSLVKILEIKKGTEFGDSILVEGADILDGTEIYDIKPYIPYVESIPDAKEGFTEQTKNSKIEVVYGKQVLLPLPEDKRQILLELLEQDPRPGFHNDESRIYGMKFSGFEVKFSVRGKKLYLLSVEKDK